MHKARLVVSGGLILALCAMAGPKVTHADVVAKSGCATGAATTMLTAPNMSFTGRATNALPVPLTTTVPPAVSIVGTENPPVVIAAPVTVVTSTIVAPMEYGLFNYIAGIKPVVFPNAENEISEFFTFSSTATSLTDMPFGGFSASNRVGTFTVYLGHGDFANAATFSSGTPIMTATYNQQILVPNAATNMATGTNAAGSLSLGVAGVPSGTSTSAGTSAAANAPELSLPTGATFTGVGTATITSATPFTYGTTCYQLGTTGQKLTVSEVGQFDSLRATSANLNGAISQSTTSTTGTTGTTTSGS